MNAHTNTLTKYYEEVKRDSASASICLSTVQFTFERVRFACLGYRCNYRNSVETRRQPTRTNLDHIFVKFSLSHSQSGIISEPVNGFNGSVVPWCVKQKVRERGKGGEMCHLNEIFHSQYSLSPFTPLLHLLLLIFPSDSC